MAVEASRPPDWFAFAAAVVSAGLTLYLQAERPNICFIVGLCVFWVGYAVVRVWQDPRVLGEWGFRREGLWPTAALCAALFVIIAGGFAAYAAVRGTFQFPLHTLILMLLYPLYGLMQEFIVLGIVVLNLARIPFLRDHTPLLVLLCASLFAAAHLHDIRELAGTFVLELLVIPIYLRYRNLWPIGVLHGWVGGLFYLWVLDRDIWTANFGSFMS